MISYGKPEFIEDLKLLWQDTFGDSRRFIDSFFNHIYKPENTLIDVEDGHAIASLYMIPYELKHSGKTEKIIYLYALATDPSYRGRRIMSDLIQKSFEICSERNYALSVLIPARESLAEFYRKFGYEYHFDKVVISKPHAYIKKQAFNHSPVSFSTANSEQIWNIYRDSIFTSEGSIILSEAQNKFYVEEIQKEGGEALVFDFEDRSYYALLKQWKTEIIVFETNMDSAVLNHFYAALVEKLSFQSLTLYQPVCFSNEELIKNSQPFAMAKKLKDINLNKPFINRVLT